MNKLNEFNNQRVFLVLTLFCLLNGIWMWQQVKPLSVEPILVNNEDKLTQKETEKVKKKENKSVQLVKQQPIEVIKAQPKAPVPAVPKPQGKKRRKSNKGVPQFVGGVSIDYFTLEQFVHRVGGAVFLYDISARKPYRWIKSGVLVKLPSNKSKGLSLVNHILTNDLEVGKVKAWIKEAQQIYPRRKFGVVAKFSKDFQDKFQQHAKDIAKKKGVLFNNIDIVRFSFMENSLFINQFVIDGKSIDVNSKFVG
ncbi:MAG: hypothetical protein OCD00_03840 [Colwellia sp.]